MLIFLRMSLYRESPQIGSKMGSVLSIASKLQCLVSDRFNSANVLSLSPIRT